MKRVCAIVAYALAAASVSAQAPNPRFGKWKLKSEAPAPTSNVMTHEPHNGKGMKIMYMRMNAEGKTANVTFATYEKLQ